jgi:hypothetical protein
MPNDKPRTPHEEWVRRIRGERSAIFARVVGYPLHVHEEPEDDPSRVDHIWFRVESPPVGRVVIAVNTLSRWNRDAGFDSRVRLGTVRVKYTRLPDPVLTRSAPLDYSSIEAGEDVKFEPYEHDPLVALLIDKGNAAERVEAWGELYMHGQIGLHQLHSRRASCAMKSDLVGQDGGLKLYFRGGEAELLLFKFCGQP